MKSYGVKIILLLLLFLPIGFIYLNQLQNEPEVESANIEKSSYWFELSRVNQKEYVYKGIPGDRSSSKLVKEFDVKTGASWSPTPLPSLLDRDYWIVVSKEVTENPDTAPYFLQLDVPVEDEWPYGPVPYTECTDVETGEPIQCDWVLPGYFGLHGVNGNADKLSDEDLGSSGCIRHTDESITYLYNLLDPENDEIRYYVLD